MVPVNTGYFTMNSWLYVCGQGENTDLEIILIEFSISNFTFHQVSNFVIEFH